MSDRMRKVAAGVLTTVSAGGALLGLAGTASASPVPGVPFTTAERCTANGGEVVEQGSERCKGGGDTGDVIVSEEQASILKQIVPKPPVPSPSLPIS